MINGHVWDLTGRFDIVKWSSLADDFKNIENNKCYLISNFALEKIQPAEIPWSTSPVKIKIRFNKDSKITLIDTPPSTIPLHPMQPTVKLGELVPRLNALGVNGYRTTSINGEQKQQPLFTLVDLSGTIVADFLIVAAS